MQATVDEGVDWLLWRLVLHRDRRPGTLSEIRQSWSVGDLVDAHVALDAIEDIETFQANEARKNAPRGR